MYTYIYIYIYTRNTIYIYIYIIYNMRVYIYIYIYIYYIYIYHKYMCTYRPTVTCGKWAQTLELQTIKGHYEDRISMILKIDCRKHLSSNY